MTARRSRRRTAAYAALALALCGSLALTGCNSSTSKKSKKTSSSSKSKKRKIIGGGGTAAGAGAGAASRRTTTCKPSSYKVRFSQIANPNGRVIVKFVNSLSRPCRLYDAPLLRFDNAAKPLPLVNDDKGMLGHSIAVPPKGKAYAVIPTSTAAAKGTEKKTVKVTFMGGVDDSDTSANMTADIKLGTGRGHNSDAISVGNTKVTNWNSSLRGAEAEAGK
ncbi:DUF4232 domain-containing protein [Streptomyces halobius]|uniref:DUF4232 domain-containing protein n=1 Tax=Streptomyces halobius TaxID=2879846 RepID=A0ABY4M9A1_9ACTN|nr:DUF4232 domain-containing protein [Streptomyces halobius]UQA94356.1 DUF4232 domain-containing protein [Streptomyces halobius]